MVVCVCMRVHVCVNLFEFSECSLITDCSSVGGNAIASVRPAGHFFALYLRNRLAIALTFNFCLQVGYDHSSQGIEGQGHGSG